MSKNTYIFIAVFLSAVLPALSGARAEMEFTDLGGVADTVRLEGELGLFYRADKNLFFGAVREGHRSAKDSSFGEFSARLFITPEKNVGWSEIEAQLAPIYMGTIGEDLYGLDEDTSNLNLSQAWLKFKKLGGLPMALTVGMQDIDIEKQFVIGYGRLPRSANWLFLNESFKFAVRIDADTGKLHSTLFWARAKDYWQQPAEGINTDVSVAGLNLHYILGDRAYLYGGFFKKFDESNGRIPDFTPRGKGLTSENDTCAWDIGFEAGIRNLLLEGEFVWQTGKAGELDGRRVDRDAYAFWGGGTYTFPIRFAPFVRFTYMHFSGDENLEDHEADDYDPMFWGWSAWNRFTIGEHNGQISLPNSNKRVSIAEIGFSPTAKLKVTFMSLTFSLDEKHVLNTRTKYRSWSDEINIVGEYAIEDDLWAVVGCGRSKPRKAAREFYGAGREAYYFQTALILKF